MKFVLKYPTRGRPKQFIRNLSHYQRLLSHRHPARFVVSIDADGTVKTRPPKRPITLRHLLTHTSGMGYDTWDGEMFKYVQAKGPFKPATMEALSTPLLFDPGEQWRYSISIDWAGFMVEAASGMKLDRYMKEKIFAPLGMADTGFRITPAMRPRKAAVHVRKEGGGFTAKLVGKFSRPLDGAVDDHQPARILGGKVRCHQFDHLAGTRLGDQRAEVGQARRRPAGRLWPGPGRRTALRRCPGTAR